MKAKKNNNDIEDDGRVISPMNVEGMPWYTPNKTHKSSSDNKPLSKREGRSYMFSALLASLLVGAVFALVFFLFIMFSVHVWLK